MKPVADYVHSKGLKFGIYSDRGTATCVGRPGSEGHETIDAQTYAKWGVDLLKEDSCSAPTDHNTSFKQYALMRDALNATGRPIYFALCGWSSWYAPVGSTLGNSWRFGYDVNGWNSAYSNSIAAQANPKLNLAADAGPGGWNDPDALIGTSNKTAVHMTEKQSRTQFSLWATMAAPLEIGSNILHMNDYDLETYMNTEVIAIDQDALGKQGSVVATSPKCNMMTNMMTDSATAMSARRRRKRAEAEEDISTAATGITIGKLVGLDTRARVRVQDGCTALPDCQQIWKRDLSNGDVALTLVNYTQVLPLQKQHHLTTSNGAKPHLVECDTTGKVTNQWWKITATNSSGGPTRIQSLADSKSGCFEINGCGYRSNSVVDTNYGCKPLPAKGVTDPCCSNMAWIRGHPSTANSTAKATTESEESGVAKPSDLLFTTLWNSSLCFRMKKGTGGGAELATCDTSDVMQLYTLVPVSEYGNNPAKDTYQLRQTPSTVRTLLTSESAAAMCVANVANPSVVPVTEDYENFHDEADEAQPALTYDIVKELGWKDGANVRDLWAHTDLGAMKEITMALAGDGDSAMYRLSKL